MEPFVVFQFEQRLDAAEAGERVVAALVGSYVQDVKRDFQHKKRSQTQ